MLKSYLFSTFRLKLRKVEDIEFLCLSENVFILQYFYYKFLLIIQDFRLNKKY